MIFAAKPAPIPPQSLMAEFAARPKVLVDCFAIPVDQAVPLETFIKAFYTSRIFKVERGLIRLFLRKPTSDAQISALAAGHIEDFAIWKVEARNNTEIVLREHAGGTRSWLRVSGHDQGQKPQLYFGTILERTADAPEPGPIHRFFFGIAVQFHLIYSRVLLASAQRNLRRFTKA